MTLPIPLCDEAVSPKKPGATPCLAVHLDLLFSWGPLPWMGSKSLVCFLVWAWHPDLLPLGCPAAHTLPAGRDTL